MPNTQHTAVSEAVQRILDASANEPGIATMLSLMELSQEARQVTEFFAYTESPGTMTQVSHISPAR